MRNIILLFLIFNVTFFLYAKGSSEGSLDKAIDSQSHFLLEQIPSNSILAIIGISSGNEDLSKYITEGITSYILNNNIKNIVIVERAAMPILQREINFQYSGNVDDNFMVSLGKMIGANTVVAGTIYSIGNELRFNIRAIEIETSIIIASNGIDFSSDNKIKSLLNGGTVEETLKKENIPVRQNDGSISKANLELRENQRIAKQELQEKQKKAMNNFVNFFAEDILDRNPRITLGYNYSMDYPIGLELGYLRNGFGCFFSFGTNWNGLDWNYIRETGDTGDPIGVFNFTGGITYPLYFDWLWLSGGIGVYGYQYAYLLSNSKHYFTGGEAKIGLSTGLFFSIKRIYFSAKYRYLFSDYETHNFMLGLGFNFALKKR